MFGTQLQSNGGSDRFSNVSIMLNQQQQQQQPNQATTHQQQFQTASQPAQQVLFPQGPQNGYNVTQKDPEWFNNPRKRAIPQAIVKRTSKRSPSVDSNQTVSDSNTSTQRSGFNSMSFGSKKDIRGVSSSQTINKGKTTDHNQSILSSNEAPPTVSLHDWQREDEFGAMVPLASQINSNAGVSLPNDTNTAFSGPEPATIRKSGFQPNAFDKNGHVGSSLHNSLENDNDNDSTPQQTTMVNESAVIVFGYPESISNLIITHFSKFGNILEDFEVLRSSSGINAATLRLRGRKGDSAALERKYPIFTGDGWVKLTYDSSSAALRALQENGQVFGGCLIGCVPYNKNVVEQLASCKIAKADDIGEVNFSVKPSTLTDSKTNFDTLASQKGSINGGANESFNVTNEFNRFAENSATPALGANGLLEHPSITYSTRRLHIKDGKSLFAHNGSVSNHNFLQSLEMKMRQQEENNKQQAGLLHKVNNWLFGWNDL